MRKVVITIEAYADEDIAEALGYVLEQINKGVELEKEEDNYFKYEYKITGNEEIGI